MNNRASRSHQSKQTASKPQPCIFNLAGRKPRKPGQPAFLVELASGGSTITVDSLRARHSGCNHIPEEIPNSAWRMIGQLLESAGIKRQWHHGTSTATISVPRAQGWDFTAAIAAILHSSAHQAT